MGKGKVLNDYDKDQIDAFHKSGRSNKEIVKLIHRSKTVVDNYIKDPESYSNNHCGGRPRATTDKERRKFLMDIKNNKMTINEARGANQIKASHTTMRRVCHESETTQFLKMKNRPALKQSHIDKRLQWAKNKMSLTTEWNDIIFTDEKTRYLTKSLKSNF